SRRKTRGRRFRADPIGAVTLTVDPLGFSLDLFVSASDFQFFANRIDAGAILQGQLGKLIGWNPLAVSRPKQLLNFLGLRQKRAISRIYGRVSHTRILDIGGANQI